ncbi:MAG: NAD-dependent epimerase/dehydratase family protein [Bdellovibrionales bacterium]|nr:NAD-dependent epimerase/dehydratase family protein [Bdellovibrionales bacterium]
MRAVVTGGAGFIGSHIVDALSRNSTELLVVDDFSTGTEANLAGAAKRAEVLEIVRTDICSNEAAQAIAEFKPDVVFHTAAQINVRRSVAEPVYDSEKNISGTVNVLAAALDGGARSVVFSSTGGAIYGEQDVFPAPEDHPARAESPYGVSKRAAELYLEYFARAYSMTTVSLRYSNVYGPRQNPKGEAGVVAIFTNRLIAGEPFKVNGDGEQTRDFVFVGDVVQANLLAATKIDQPGFSVYNVGTGVETSVNEVVLGFRDVWSAIRGDAAGDAIEVVNGPELPGEQRRSVIDAGKIASKLGWKVSVDLRAGLEETVRSFL